MKNLRAGTLLLATALSVLGVLTGCATHVGVGYRVYDPYYSDYHPWNDRETVYYNQWIVDTHRDHRDYRHLRKQDQREYWQWRHNHPDHR